MSIQAIKDAIADAATLRLVAGDVAAHCYGGYWDGRPCSSCNEAARLLRAIAEAHDAIGHALAESGRWGRIQVVYAEGCAAARAIFRVLPELRGDR